MGRKLKQKLSGVDDAKFDEQLRRVVMKNIGNIERWLDVLGENDPKAALRAWSDIAEYVQAKKPRDAKPPNTTNINIALVPAQKPERYIDITPEMKLISQKSKMNTDFIFGC